jgi:DnaD/phage-associated family protein
VLLEGLGGEEALRWGLDGAVERGTLIAVTTQGEDAEEWRWYFLNDQRGRRAVEGVWRGEIELGGVPISHASGPSPQRPNIFTLYEQNIGLLQPIIAEQLAEAEGEYPFEWIEKAFRLAAERNVRHWRYVQRILERWARQGRRDGEPGPDTEEERRRRYIEGEYADYIEH